MHELTLVVPCYNEARRLATGEFDALVRRTPGVQLLFVDDGSSDDTRRRLESLAAGHPRAMRVLALVGNRGKAEAVRAGLLRALDGDVRYVGFWDADLATPLAAVAELVAVLADRPEVDWAIGARVQLLGREIHRSALRHYLGRIFATAASLVLRMPVYDTQCGAKIFRAAPELREILARPFRSRWIFDVELMLRLARLRQARGGRPARESIVEVPLARWDDVAGSKVRGRDFARASLELVRIWRDSTAWTPAAPPALVARVAAAEPPLERPVAIPLSAEGMLPSRSLDAGRGARRRRPTPAAGDIAHP